MSGLGKKRSASVVEDSDSLDEQKKSPRTVKKSKSAAAAAHPSGKDDQGNPFWELSSKRRVGVSQFKKMFFVNIREYYEKDGKMLPGKKGISLSVEQYAALVKAAPGINKSLAELGAVVDSESEGGDGPPAPAVKSKKDRPKPSKANIEATSDEDED